MLWLLSIFSALVPSVQASTCQGTLSPNNQCNYYGVLVLGPLCSTVIQCTEQGWQQCQDNGVNPCIAGGPTCSPGCQGKLYSTALATCNVLGITDPTTCNNTFVSNGNAGGIWQFSQCFWGDNGKCNQQTNFCPYDIDDKYSANGTCPATPTGNVCWPSTSCNVCATCCQSYLTDQSACDGCVQQECPPATNVCWPSSNCNVCSTCCQSYLTDQSACDGCVAQECTSEIMETIPRTPVEN